MTTQRLFRNIALRILLLGAIGTLMTYVHDMISATNYWGDTAVTYANCSWCDDTTWGPRHYWYFWTCFLLWVLGLVRMILLTVEEANKIGKA